MKILGTKSRFILRVCATLVIVVNVGLLASIPVITQKPIAFLRNENGG